MSQGPRKMNWLRMENRIRNVLETAQSYSTNDAATQNDLALLLVAISDIVGEETGRGYEINPMSLIHRFPDTRTP